MYQDKITLCASSAYERKYYLNEDFAALPQSIQDELKIMCVLFTEDVGGILTLSFEEDGAGVDRFSTMEYLIFGPNDQVTLQGFAPEACLVCDGNPYLLPSDSVQVRYETNLVRTITL